MRQTNANERVSYKKSHITDKLSLWSASHQQATTWTNVHAALGWFRVILMRAIPHATIQRNGFENWIVKDTATSPKSQWVDTHKKWNKGYTNN